MPIDRSDDSNAASASDAVRLMRDELGALAERWTIRCEIGPDRCVFFLDHPLSPGVIIERRLTDAFEIDSAVKWSVAHLRQSAEFVVATNAPIELDSQLYFDLRGMFQSMKANEADMRAVASFLADRGFIVTAICDWIPSLSSVIAH